MPPVLKQTTRQAKAAFNARGRPSLTKKERRQLERSIELEQRAEKIKEAEKRRNEATKRRAARESREKLGQANSAQLGSQRRCDRFGYKSSQFHLGAFFGTKPAANQAEMHQQGEIKPLTESDDDVFEDEDLDDDSLLEALSAPAILQMQAPRPLTGGADTSKTATSLMPPPPLPAKCDQAQPDRFLDARAHLDMQDFFDELDSSTQIARELDDHDTQSVLPEPKSNARSGSFSSGSLDLTVDDLEALDPPKSATVPLPLPVLKMQHVMAPPAVPVSQQRKHVWHAATVAVPRKTLTPVEQQRAIHGRFLPASSLYCSTDLGFTATQLESFIDDDIQLTQMAT
ncbi:uncharacterized protein MYCFIDRAFT_196757 [Pseudocercospora fijiensis CIRAD86]|uniref:Uncharacterized protein n=1 Tax=Pseudocercospora fijiensis (strain CIRAD86) TaxID=383855 RepID=M2Z0Y3_PSEFD|nr:uncharacterized protein MYCFIDRAFT_196757 [Pseudocercospora fijiensis CIRAD86]EME83500.1 hypothetical protein MYCFIDRAFT_196757 [Pseudocercospora fijiensis CIRAD86]